MLNRKYWLKGLAGSVLMGVMTQTAYADSSRTLLNPVTVTATRIAVSSYDVPAAISSVDAETLRANALGVNLADDIASVPGLLARNRNNYAQDQQVSIRGFGASSAFGIRGIRVYQDGMPATGPDGQGQVSQFNLDSASHVEILRGPFSALYGNSSGGVIQIFTQDGQEPMALRSSVAGGSYGTFRASVNANGEAGPFGYNTDFTHFAVDGYRDHSSARSESFNGKLNYSIDDANKLTLILNVLSRPDTDDPLGLTEAQFRADPDQTDANAISFNTRKSLSQKQAGLIYDLQFDAAQSIRLLGYYGERSVEQFLSVATGAQTPATSAGGVVNLERSYGGGDARWSWQSSLMNRPATWVVGLTYDRQNEHRRGYNNFVGATLGVQGALRRDENNIATDFDQYVQGTWEFAPQWSLMLGVRRSEVNFDSQDHYIVTGNGNDSGELTFSATSPVAGVMFDAQPWLHLYASFGSGFQTPIGSELAYRADGGSGLNPLQAAFSSNGEVGAKMQFSNFSAEAALFRALTRDDIVLNTNSGGRSTYQNASTRRQGAELSFDYRITDRLQAQFAYTYIDAIYRESFLTCTATPCPTPTVLITEGNRLPGVPKHNVFAAMRWGDEAGLNAALNVQAVSAVPVHDLNLIAAPGYGVVGVSAGYAMNSASLRLNAFVRLNNILDKRYVGSIIVGDGNSRFFEPAPGRNVLAGISVTCK